MTPVDRARLDAAVAKVAAVAERGCVYLVLPERYARPRLAEVRRLIEQSAGVVDVHTLAEEDLRYFLDSLRNRDVRILNDPRHLEPNSPGGQA